MALPEFYSIEQDKTSVPDWAKYMRDGGIASVHYGIEMGQHCMINWIQHNLMFDNGKPADERLPNGVTGWIKEVSEK